MENILFQNTNQIHQENLEIKDECQWQKDKHIKYLVQVTIKYFQNFKRKYEYIFIILIYYWICLAHTITIQKIKALDLFFCKIKLFMSKI